MESKPRAHGDNIIAQCDEPGCERLMPRDALHTCMACGGYYCDGHITLSDAGLLCRPCYALAAPAIEAKIQRDHANDTQP